MRTTIEMKPEHRARLMEIAARRDEKGFSNVVAEAIDLYLNSIAENERRRTIAVRLRGCLNPQERDELRALTSKLGA